MAVQHRDQRRLRPRAEARLEAFHRLRRQRDFRHQHHRPFALFEGVGDGLQIHLGLAAARDAVQQKGCRPRFAGHRFPQGGQRPGLRRVERQRLRWQNVLARVGIALRNFRGDPDQAPVFQPAHRPRRGLAQRQQFPQGQFAARPHDLPHLPLPARQLRRLSRGGGAHLQPRAPVRLLAPHRHWQHAFQRGLRRAAIILADPPRQLQDPGRHQ